MKRYAAFSLLVVLFCPPVLAQEKSSGDLIRLVAALDEPEFYCFDLAGWGKNLQLDDPLQTHTCKATAFEDQLFQLVDNRIKVVGHDRCVQVAGSSGGTLPGSAVLVRPCSNNALQELSLNAAGQIMIGTTGYCIGAGTQSKPASGPSHMWRTLTAVDCAAADASLLRWQVGMK
jgi:hypothetical protein